MGCYVWYHFDCLGLSQSDAEELGAAKEAFVCPNCIAHHSNTPTLHAISGDSVQCSGAIPSNSTSVFEPYTDFLWGEIHGEFVCDFMLSAYERVVHWQPSVFLIPFGRAGKRFVKEIARLL